ncbi:uncharacterized protein STEHIDRAFT_163830 [Stereum hirsutum FP-91666 SS1]|uniref:Uncharacterized protein n=1 Tax=Stereum hirsutum (strain FP-91666) TaxID=721885 RepID=R7RVU7_STEHR|nr:uncharacterized protein STEHIDRAFT_163830 [Stereum hirsutum FP-91666 SS1]EIM79309.1 hypothetical protein STEHIDRAFT_163830 [Stereum hirsutum FP-91666 SS1]
MSSSDSDPDSEDEDDEETTEHQDIARVAASLGLKPESQHALKLFIKKSAAMKMNIVYACMLALTERADTKEERWVPSGDLAKDIRRFCLAVLLSSKLAAYRTAADQAVLKVLRRHGTNLPEDWESNPSRKDAIMKAIGSGLTDERSRVKAAIRDSLDPKMNIADLAEKVVGNSGITPTVDLWARLSLLRQTIVQEGSHGRLYWLHVDECLKQTREMAFKAAELAQETSKYPKYVSKEVAKALTKDYDTYGYPTAKAPKHMTKENSELWQLTAEAESSVLEPARKSKKRPKRV